MKNFFIAIILILPLTLFSKNSDTTQVRRITKGLTFSPTFCYRSLNADAASQWIADMRNGTEAPKYGFSLGFNLKIHVFQRLSLETGITYSEKGLQTKKTDLAWTIIDASLPVNTKTVYQYHYLCFPLVVDYSFRCKKFKWFISGGISSNLFGMINTAVITEQADGAKTKTTSLKDAEGFSDMNFSLVIGAGINYNLSKKFILKAEPVFNQSFTSSKSDAHVKEYPYTLGLDVGIYFNFKKKKIEW